MKRGVLFALAAAHCLAQANAEPLSPVDRYLQCVQGAAALSAHSHVGDPEVARSPAPEVLLRILVYDYFFGTDAKAGACSSQHDAVGGDDEIAAGMRTYEIVMAAVQQALAEHPPRRQPWPGSNDYAHGEKLAPGAWQWLSAECQATLKDGVAPSSCADAVREANRVEKNEAQAEEKKVAGLPSVRYCLGLEYDTMPEKTESVVNEALGRVQAMNDEEFSRLTDCSLRVRSAGLPIIQYCLGLNRTASQNPFDDIFDEDRIVTAAMGRLRGMGAVDWANVGACAKRVAAAGGLYATDPAGELLRVGRIEEVQDASKQYDDCVTGRAVQMARSSQETAETIAKAALGGCGLPRRQYLAVFAKALDIAMTPERAAEEEKETTGKIIGRVIDARAKKEH